MATLDAAVAKARALLKDPTSYAAHKEAALAASANGDKSAASDHISAAVAHAFTSGTLQPTKAPNYKS